jgi:hypothetical protein
MKSLIDMLRAVWHFATPSIQHNRVMSRDLVMGCAAGYTPAMARPFVESLLSVGSFTGEAVVFVRPTDADLIAYLRKRDVTAIPFVARDFPIPNVHMARYFAYSAYLRSQTAKGKHYRSILLSDVRDVTFQKKLFSTPCGELELHYESPTPRIGEEDWNAGWIRREFGEEALKALTGKRISCSGTVSGQTEGILDYLDTMQSVMLGLPEDIKAGEHGDQAVHNYCLYNGLFRKCIVLENFVRVATLHFVKATDLRINNDGLIINPDGLISEIAHQWDRHADLAAAIMKKYVEMPQSDRRSWLGLRVRHGRMSSNRPLC